MPAWIVAVVLGIIEGITEFLPVSSTGHLLVAEHLLGVHQTDLFNIVIQCGAVVAVLPLFSDRLSQFWTSWREAAVRDYMAKIVVAFAVTGVGGVALEKAHFKLPETALPVGLALLVGGVLFLAIERHLKGRKLNNDITWAVVAAVGFGQLLAAVFPGASRSGTTILLALLLGLARPAATEFSFLVGIPTMLAAGGLKIFKEIHHAAAAVPAPTEDWGLLILATVAAALVSFVAVKWLLRYVQGHTFAAFGWYRIAAGTLVLALMG